MLRLPFIAIATLFVAGGFVGQGYGVESQWVRRGTTSRLVYVPDAQGDRIPDFSNVGYRAGKMGLPDVPVAVTVAPVAGDDTANIQSAINQVSALPLGVDGFRGAVLLNAGDYQIGGQLTIGASGVVLRGVGRDTDGTVLHATGTSQRDLIEIVGSGSQSLTGSTRNMIDKTVPVGARSFRVDSTSGFAVGDAVRITRPSTADWISDLGMDSIPPRSDGGPITQWEPGSIDIRFDRVITRIEGDRLFVDAPLTNAFELQYGGGQIKKYEWLNRIENVGVENLQAESDYSSDTDEDHSWNFVSIDKAQHVWVQNTTSAHFAHSAVLSNPGAKWVTVDNAINLEPKSQITGGRRYTFDLSGQLELVTNSEANEGRHDFINNSTRPAGPHVFHNSVANNALDESGPHQRWATGSLFDNIAVDGDQINARNRGNFGTGHGWAGANMVIWNSTAESYIVQNPPTAQNWIVGSTGTIIDDDTFGPQPAGYIDSHNTPVGIDSLYEAQVADAADVLAFHWTGTAGNWLDPEGWREKLTPGGYEVEVREYLIGDIDDFVADGPASVDNAFVDPAWANYILGTSAHPLTGFDDASGNRNVAFTIQHQLDSGERVVHGTLALSLRQAGGAIDTDFVRLFDSDPAHKLLFSELGWDAQVNNSEAFVGVLDLGTVTEQLQSGAVNVQINDDTAVDWGLYSITVAKPLVETPATEVFIDSGGQAFVNTTIDNVMNLSLGGSSPGGLALAAAGTLSLSGSYTQSPNGTLQVELSDATDSAMLAMAESALIEGNLVVTLQQELVPLLGDEFAILAAVGGVHGRFDSVDLPDLDAGLGWTFSYSGDAFPLEAFTLEVVLAGDFNHDGVVGMADYALWRDNLGSTTTIAIDADRNGVVDIGDYNIWRAGLGLSASDFPAPIATSQGHAVPEPTSLTMLLALSFIGSMRRSYIFLSLLGTYHV